MEADLMLLCDIGNTSFHFNNGQDDYKESAAGFDPSLIGEDVYYVNVNPQMDSLLSSLPNWINLAEHIDRARYYDTMGIDRIMAVEAISHGVVVDAGSAITVDIVKQGNFEGGFIYPGVDAMRECYKSISARLDYSFNFELELDKMPKNSRDAVSYGYLRLFYGEVTRHGMPIFLTGGNASMLQPLFPEATLDEALIFKGMRKIIDKVF